MGDPYNPAGTLHPTPFSFDGGHVWLRREMTGDKYYRCEPPEGAKQEAHKAWHEHLQVMLHDESLAKWKRRDHA